MRICLIGYGNIARKHIEILRHFEADIVASSNRSVQGNTAAKNDAGIPRTYQNYLEMIEVEKPDAILNCVTHNAIYETTKNVIPLGIPLLVEKPAGTTVSELKELIRLQEQYKTPVQVALNRRHYSIFQKAIEDMGGSQNLDMISVEWSERPLRAKEDKGYTDTMVEEILVGNSIHGIDLLNYFAGEMENYETFTASRKGAYFHWNMAFSGISKTGVVANFTSSWGSPVPWRVVMYSKDKRYEFAPLETCKVYGPDPKANSILEPEEFDSKFKAGFYKQAAEFVQMVRTGQPNSHSLESTMQSMSIAEALVQSLKS